MYTITSVDNVYGYRIFNSLWLTDKLPIKVVDSFSEETCFVLVVETRAYTNLNSIDNIVNVCFSTKQEEIFAVNRQNVL